MGGCGFGSIGFRQYCISALPGFAREVFARRVLAIPMWIVALALRRPYTFVGMALLIIILTPITILRTPVDIFPDINIPLVSVIWKYTGLPPRERATRS